MLGIANEEVCHWDSPWSGLPSSTQCWEKRQSFVPLASQVQPQPYPSCIHHTQSGYTDVDRVLVCCLCFPLLCTPELVAQDAGNWALFLFLFCASLLFLQSSSEDNSKSTSWLFRCMSCYPAWPFPVRWWRAAGLGYGNLVGILLSGEMSKWFLTLPWGIVTKKGRPIARGHFQLQTVSWGELNLG